MTGFPTPADLPHLRACVDLAREALEAGDQAFGSLLVDAEGRVRRRERNRVRSDDDRTRHPEFALARWAAEHLDPRERAGATVYTSGEHCPMCAAAHAWVGLGPIVYAVSAAQFAKWLDDWQIGPSPVAALPIRAVAPGLVTRGPAPELEAEVRALHRRHFGLDPTGPGTPDRPDGPDR